MSLRPPPAEPFPLSVDIAIVGAGACGLTAALAAREAGANVLVLERDAVPRGSTALSSGMVIGAGTRFQQARGVADSPELLARDILAKNKGKTDRALVDAIARESGPAVDWLADRHGVPFSLVEGFLYPGHSVARMHAPPTRSGAELIGALTRAAEAAGIDIVTQARVADLFADESGRVVGLEFERPDGAHERVGCGVLIMACSGFGGDKAMVRRYIPSLADAWFFGHDGNRGDAMRWGEALGAALADMGAAQGHGSVATPHGALITWGLMMEGGFQVNAAGERFSNEHRGYSEQAEDVLAQPGGVAWNIFDARLAELGRQFEDFKQAEAGGALLTAPTIVALSARTGLPADALAATLRATAELAAGRGKDRFGRDFSAKPPLAAPFCAIKVTGALFHTQGGLVVDTRARVLRPDGTALPNLFAGGGAARGISGPGIDGYLSGNGLLPAIALGRIAGREAARSAKL